MITMMQNRQHIEIGIAAQHWRGTQLRRLNAVREKRLATEAVKSLPTLLTLLSPERRRQEAAEKALTTAKRTERKALSALAKLCDRHAAAGAKAEDVLTVDEVQALPRIEVGETS